MSAATTRTLEVALGERRYPIHVGPGLLDDAAALAALAPGRHVLVVTDANVAPHYLARVEAAFRKLSAGYFIQAEGDDYIVPPALGQQAGIRGALLLVASS